MKIVIVNQPMGNRGDESAHRAMVRSLVKSYPKVDIELLVSGFSFDQIKDIIVDVPNIKYSILNSSRGEFRIIDWAIFFRCKFLLNIIPSNRKLMKSFHSADLVVCAPGGICMGGFQNWRHVYYLLIAKMMNKPIAYFGRSIGPFPTRTKSERKFRKYAYNLLHYFSFISLRDSKSVRIALDGKIDLVSTVDTAFLDSTKGEIPFRIKEQIRGARFIVFVPNSLTWHYAFKEFSQELIDKFYIGLLKKILEKEPEIKILMLPQLHNFMHNDDKYYFADLLEKVSNKRIKLIDDMYGSDIQQSIISRAEYVVGARYHSVVFAINQAVPFVSLSYEHKMTGLLEMLGIEDCMVDITNIFADEYRVDSAISNVMAKINNTQQNVLKSKEWQNKAKLIAGNGFESFKTFINSIKTI